MKIYKLEPKNSSDSNWQASNYLGTVIARAKDELRAIELASHAFTTRLAKKPGQPILLDPWVEYMVTCTEISDSEYSAEGEEEILLPNK